MENKDEREVAKMALKQVVLSRKIADKRAELKPLLEKRDELAKKKTGMQTREAELEAAVNEITEETTQEDRDALDASVGEFEAEAEALDGEIAANEEAIGKLDTAIGKLESELDEINKKAEAPAAPPAAEPAAANPQRNERSEYYMNTRDLIPKMTLRDRVAGIVTREDVKGYLSEVRAAIKEKRAITNAGLLIPEVMLGMIREEIAQASRLLRFVDLRPVSGKARQNIMGKIPEAVWTEMCADLNELSLSFNQVEVDGYKVGGFVVVCNAILEDSDIALASEIITAIGGAIGKALDKAIIFGTGTKQPIGFITRLAQTSQPANWGTYAPAWEDLHTSNVVTLNIDASSGAAFFQALIEKLAIAKPVYSNQGLFWVMNRRTHLHILAKALAFDSSAALVANTNLFPIIGGTIVEFEDDLIPDNWIGGGFGGNYLLAERAGIEFASSDIPRFLNDQTVFKGTARYDGMPVAGKAFVVVRFDNTAPATTDTFPVDWANTELNELTIVAAASASNTGKTVLTVTDYLADADPVLYYKLGTQKVAAGDAIATSGTGAWTALTSGSTEITAAAGKKITVVELNAAAASGGLVVSAGVVASVPKAS